MGQPKYSLDATRDLAAGSRGRLVGMLRRQNCPPRTERRPVRGGAFACTTHRSARKVTTRPGCLHDSSHTNTAARSYRQYRPRRTAGIVPERVDSRTHDTGTASRSAHLVRRAQPLSHARRLSEPAMSRTNHCDSRTATCAFSLPRRTFPFGEVLRCCTASNAAVVAASSVRAGRRSCAATRTESSPTESLCTARSAPPLSSGSSPTLPRGTSAAGNQSLVPSSSANRHPVAP